MPNINIAKYQRPGIYTEYFNDSVIETPVLQGIQTLVIGVSKTGAVNTPIVLNSPTALSQIFGELDRGLEAKGSFFHRTIRTILPVSPVVAFNIFNPDDTLDLLEYKSISTASGYENDIKRTAPYRRFFDTSSFWKKDREAVLSITSDNVGDNTRLFHMTNFSDKPVTAFIVKSKQPGFNVTLDEWYSGSEDKLPLYLDGKEYASDYLVDVYLVSGDWTDYDNLSIDPVWGVYFDSTGIRKEQIDNFYNSTRVTSLRLWAGLSLIPYFRDANNSDIFIETRINAETTTTGLYCAFNIDALEQTYRTGLIDLVGNDLIADKTLTSIDFLSYTDSIIDELTYSNVILDRAGNVNSLLFTENLIGNSCATRTAYFSEGFINGLTMTYDSAITGTASAATFTVEFTLAAAVVEQSGVCDGATVSAYAVMNGTEVELAFNPDDNGSFVLTATDLSSSGSVVFFIDTDGVIKINPTTTQLTNGIVLGYVSYTKTGNNFVNSTSYIPVSLDTNGYKLLSLSTDVTIATATSGGVDNITYTFVGTTGSANPANYLAYRRFKLFSRLSAVFTGVDKNEATLLINGSPNGPFKKSLEDLTVTTVSSSSSNKSITISGFESGFFTGTELMEVDGLVVYTTDDEFIMADGSLTTKDSWVVGTSGIVAKYSQFYLDYVNGIISSGDYFTDTATSELTYIRAYKNVDSLLTVEFVDESLEVLQPTTNSNIVLTSQKSNYRQSVEVETFSGYTSSSNKILISGSRYTELKVGDFLQADVDTSNLEVGEVPRMVTRILSKKQFAQDTSLVEITCDSAIKIYSFGGDLQTYRFSSIDDYVSTYKGISLFGFRYRTESLPNGTDERLTEILQVITKGTPLYEALTDKNILDVRYLVDSFGLGLTEESKKELAYITGKRKDTYGILNMPSMKQFRRSTSPTFVDNEGRLIASYIKNGGNPESNPAFLYSFVTDEDSTTTNSYFTPYVTVNDNGRPMSVPPAAYVAITFLRKHFSTIPSVTPWTIAAGSTDGLISGISGLEMEFTGEFIKELNLMKANPIVIKKNRGFAIETDNTSERRITSALSYTHVREVLIELERALAAMLDRYQWKYNTPEIRSEIKLRADAICEDFVTRNGLFNFFNKCDAENNTPDIIDNQIGVLDTYVEPIKGMGIIVNNITVLRTNAISSSGFSTN